MGARNRRAALAQAVAITAALAGGLWAAAPAWADAVQLVGISGDRALLVAGGQPPRFVRVGESLGGIRLVAVQGQEARLLVDGRPLVLRVGETPVQVGQNASASGADRVVLTADSQGHFHAQGSINGGTVTFLVDTGATWVVLGQPDAARLGLQAAQARPVRVNTANGAVQGLQFQLQKVRLGDAEVGDVTAVVLPHAMPFVLLGNSFLTRFQMKRINDQLTLERRR